MNILVQISLESSKDDSFELSSRQLRMFAMHKSIFNESSKKFIHYILAIGYTGGDSQEECFYKIEGSNLDKASIFIASTIADHFYQYTYHNQQLNEEEKEWSQEDLKVIEDLIIHLNSYLYFDNNANCYAYKTESNYLKNNIFTMDSKFPIKTLSYLKKVYWPFLTSW
jgi:hypothetical protein